MKARYRNSPLMAVTVLVDIGHRKSSFKRLKLVMKFPIKRNDLLINKIQDHERF
jgi:hypothetical protein